MAVWQPGTILEMTKSLGAAMGIIKSAVLEGWSRNATQKYLKEHGMGIRRETLLSAYNAVKYAEKDPSVYLPGDDTLPPREELIPLATTRQKRAYHVDVTTRFWDADLQTIEESTITLSEDELMPVDELLTLGAEIALQYGFDVDNVLESRISRISYSANPILG